MVSEVLEDLSITDFSEGQTFSFQKTIDESDLTKFAQLSGDSNPLHMNDSFAKKQGFKGRVVYGLLLSSFFSKLVGMYLPGKKALLHSVNTRFLSPAYINDTIIVSAVIDQISLSTKILVLKGTIKNKDTGNLLVKGKIQVGFTQQFESND
ncbi:MAG: MaoC family dehydratase [Pseudomonadota bacterium]